jgi:hypothetical protein
MYHNRHLHQPYNATVIHSYCLRTIPPASPLSTITTTAHHCSSLYHHQHLDTAHHSLNTITTNINMPPSTQADRGEWLSQGGGCSTDPLSMTPAWL